MNETPSAPAVLKASRGYYYFTLIASLIGAAVQMILLLSEYDTAIGMYRSGSVLATIFTAFVLLVTGGILIMPLVTRKASVPEQPEADLPEADMPVIFASTLSGFILVAVLILQLVIGLPFHSFQSLSDYFWIAVLVLAIPTAVFFFLPVLPLKNKKMLEKALGFFPVIWCMAYLMSIFYDNSTALNSPVRILTELAMIGSMLFFLMELRVRVGKPQSAFRMTFICLSIFYSSICAIPMISVAFINQWILKADILYSAVQLCFLTYFIARANTLVRR